MNLLHMEYAVEVARTGSINKAAESLFVAQPNLSRSIKELEAELGIKIFERSYKGMILTPSGEMFLRYARKVLDQVDVLEKSVRNSDYEKERFSISVPRASYISDAFAQFSKRLGKEQAELFYMETNSSEVLMNITENDYNLGIIRYPSEYEPLFMELLEEKGMTGELVVEFQHVILLSNENPLSKKEILSMSELKDMIEISLGDPYVPSIPVSILRNEGKASEETRMIYLYGRGGQFDLLTENPDTFMMVSPIPEKLLKRYNLSQKICIDHDRWFKDVLVRKKDYAFSNLDNEFITELIYSKRQCFKAYQQ